MIFQSTEHSALPFRVGQPVMVYSALIGDRPGAVVLREAPADRPPVNPILVAFREKGAEFFGGIEGWLRYAMHGTHVLGTPITPEQIEHAHRVLTRLAALGDAA